LNRDWKSVINRVDRSLFSVIASGVKKQFVTVNPYALIVCIVALVISFIVKYEEKKKWDFEVTRVFVEWILLLVVLIFDVVLSTFRYYKEVCFE
jgi:hypothetical protein